MPKTCGEQISIRWAINADIEEMLTIENEAFQYPWSEREMTRFMRRPNVVTLVAEVQLDSSKPVVGYALYSLDAKVITLHSLAVDHTHRRRGIGALLFTRIKSRLREDRRVAIESHVSDRNLIGQLFLASQGMKAERIDRGLYSELGSDDDAYLMRVALSGATLRDTGKWKGVNRIQHK